MIELKLFKEFSTAIQGAPHRPYEHYSAWLHRDERWQLHGDHSVPGVHAVETGGRLGGSAPAALYVSVLCVPLCHIRRHDEPGQCRIMPRNRLIEVLGGLGNKEKTQAVVTNGYTKGNMANKHPTAFKAVYHVREPREQVYTYKSNRHSTYKYEQTSSEHILRGLLILDTIQ